MRTTRSRTLGFALLEALIALLVGAFAIFAIVKLQGFIFQSSGLSTARSEAVTLAQAKMEELRAGAVTRTAFANLTPVQLCDTVSGASATNATFNRCWVSAAFGTLDARTLSVTVTWVDASSATQTIALNAVLSWDDVLGQAIFAKPPTGSMIAPVGQAQRGSGRYSPLPTTGLQRNTDFDGTTYTYTREDSRRELLDANGNILLFLEPKNNAPQSFVVISGRIFFDLAEARGLPDPRDVKVRLSSEGTCIETGKGAGGIADLATVSGTGAGALTYGYFDYYCYVGPGWYGNVGVTVSDGARGNAPVVCVGDPAFNNGNSNGTLIGANAVTTASRTYRGFREVSGSPVTYISTGAAGGSTYPSSGRPKPSDYPDYYPGVAAQSQGNAFNHHFLMTSISGKTTCADRMAGGVFFKNAGKYFCIDPHDSTDLARCPNIWPNFEGEVGSGGGSGGQTFRLSVALDGSGSVSGDVGGIDCGTSCVADLASGTPVNLRAMPAPGQFFVGWSGDCNGSSNPCTVQMTAARSVTAKFQALPLYTLTVLKAGTGSGTVSSSPEGIDCGAICSKRYVSGTVIRLSASPVSGSFSGWSGIPGCSTSGNCEFTITGDVSTTATFTASVPANLELEVKTVGQGSVASNPSGITCPAASVCNALFSSTTGTVTLTATPASNYSVSWSGCTSVTGNQCQVSMTANQSVTASFNLIRYTLSVDVRGRGTVTSSVGGISCPGTCSVELAPTTTVELTASPPNGQTFTGWTGGNCTGIANRCTVTMNENRSATASFSCNTVPSGGLPARNSTVLAPVIDGTNTSAGSCTKDGSNIASYTCQINVPQGTIVRLGANTAGGGSSGTTKSVTFSADCGQPTVNIN